jgi:hypothetical protein
MATTRRAASLPSDPPQTLVILVALAQSNHKAEET